MEAATDFDPVPALLKDPEISTKPLKKSSDTYANLTKRGNVENPSVASQNLDPKLASPRQALDYVKSMAGAAENTVLKDIFSKPESMMSDFGVAGIMELNGVFKGLTGQDIEVQPETLKAMKDRQLSPEIAHVAGQVVGGTILWASMGAALRATSLAEAAGSFLYKTPALVKYVKPAIEWGVGMGGSSIFKEGLKQIDEGTLDFERFGKVVAQDTLEGAIGGAIVGGMPTGSLSKGVLRALGASAYGFGSTKLKGGSTAEAITSASMMALFATASTKEVTEAQREGIYKTGVKAVSEAFKEAGANKGYSPAESEQLGTMASDGFKKIIEEAGGTKNLNVGKVEETLGKVKDLAQGMIGEKPADEPVKLEVIKPDASEPRIIPDAELRIMRQDAIAHAIDKADAKGNPLEVVSPELADSPRNRQEIAKKSPETQSLPSELKGAKPRYGYGQKLFELNFESDLDKAKYIIAQEKPSKQDEKYLKFVMDATDMTEVEARASGKDIRTKIKAMAKISDEPVLDILASDDPSSPIRNKAVEALSQPPKFPKAPPKPEKTYPSGSLLSELLPPKPSGIDVYDVVKGMGGIDPAQAGDLKEMGSSILHLYNKKTGVSVSRALESLIESGHLPEDASESDLQDLIHRRVTEGKQYPKFEGAFTHDEVDQPRPVNSLDREQTEKAIAEVHDIAETDQKMTKREINLLGELHAHRKNLIMAEEQRIVDSKRESSNAPEFGKPENDMVVGQQGDIFTGKMEPVTRAQMSGRASEDMPLFGEAGKPKFETPPQSAPEAEKVVHEQQLSLDDTLGIQTRPTPKWTSEAGAVVNPVEAMEKVSKAILNDKGTGIAQRMRDYVTIDPVPKLARQGVADSAVEHAAARIATPHIVNDLLSQVFPESYKNPAEMSKTIDILNKDNILAGYDSFVAKANQELDRANYEGQARWMKAANAVAEAHDLKAYDAQVREALKDPEISANIERWKQKINPELDRLFNAVKAVDPNTLREGRGRHTEARINLVIKKDEERWADAMADSSKGMPGAGTSSYRNPNVKRDPFDIAADFTGSYTKDAKTSLTAVMAHRWNEATKVRFYQDLVNKGVGVVMKPGIRPPEAIQGQPVSRLPIRFPRTGEDGKTIETEMTLYVRQDMAREIRDVLNTDMRMDQNPVAKFLTMVQIAQISDLVTHSKNLLSAVTRAQGAGSAWTDITRKMPVFNSIDALVRIGHVSQEVLADTPEIRAEIADMARQGLLRQEFPPTGIARITHGQQFIHKFDTASRVILNRFFTNLVERGLMKDTLEARRSFVNDAGQYNSRLMGSWMRSMRDMGLSPFVVAGRNFNRLGRKMLTGDPGVGATSASAAAQMRLLNLLQTALLFTIPMMFNYLRTGKVGGRSGTPLGALDLGLKEDKNGKHTTLDLLQISGLRRGMRSIGLEALIEGYRSGQSVNEISGKAFKQSYQSALHPWVGPAVGFGMRAVTGAQLDMRGQMDAKKVKDGGGMQYVENFRAALEGQNALVYSMTLPAFQHLGLDTKPRESWGMEFGKTFLSSPKSAFGIKQTATTAGQKITEVWANREVPRSTAEQMATRKLGQDISESKDFMNDLMKAMDAGKITLQQARRLMVDKDLTYVQRNVKRFTIDEALSVAEVATPEEKAGIEDEIYIKFKHSMKKMSMDKEEETLARIEKLYPTNGK